MNSLFTLTNDLRNRAIFLWIAVLFCSVSAMAQSTSWKGTSSTSWSNAANWTNGIPSASLQAIVGDANFTGTNQPSITYASSCKGLTIGGAKLANIKVDGPLTVSGNVTINSNGTLSLDTTLTLTGNWINSGTFSTIGVNSIVVFGGATQSIGGANVTTFRKLTINRGSTLKLNRNITVSGTGNLCTISGTLDPNESPAYVATVGDVVLNDGSTVKITTADYTGNFTILGYVTMNPGFIVEYASNTVNQVITNVLVYSTLKISGSSVKTLQGNLYPLNSAAANRGNIYVNGGTLDIGTNLINRGTTVAGGTISVGNGAKLRIGGTSAFPTGYSTLSMGSNGTVEYYGTNQTVKAGTYGNLMLSGTGTKTVAGALDLGGDFDLTSSTFVAGAYTHNIAGDWNITSGTFTNTGSTINFDGTDDQALNSIGNFNILKVNKASGSIVLSRDVTATTVNFVKGNITTGNYKLVVPSGGSVTGATATTGWVEGNLQKYFSATAGGTFEIGGPSHYSPLSLTFAAVSTAGNLIAGVTPTSHANINTSTLANKNISRFWTLSKPATGGIVYSSAVITFNWNDADNYTPLIASALRVAKYTSNAWTYPTLSGTPTATSRRISGVTTLGDFAVGETSACTISSGFSFSANNFCSNASTVAVVMNSGATKGTFSSSPAGLSINATTGAITPSASTPGTYNITNRAELGVCISTSTYTITITAAPSATIAYANATMCQTGSLQNVTFTGKTGGTYTSTSGLDLDPTTGQIDPSGCVPGTYTVTYSIRAASGCAAFTTTTAVSITEANFAVISYPESPYCKATGGTAAVEITGELGGTFSSATGLSINATTGDINLSATTAGTYTVTYTVPAANGCAPIVTTTSITVSATATATISYAGNPFCGASGSINVTRTGTAGGTYDSDNGLDIDETTGAINLSNSLPGLYTVVYNGAGCQATTQVRISAVPSATISYGATALCTNGGTKAVTRTGTAGGVFSASNSDLVINTATGAINLAASKEGTYTITYTVAAAYACSQFVTTTTVTVNAAPAATISYSNAPYCVTEGGKNVSRSGTSGGTFSASPAGLVINATTGAITPASSTPGTYTVSLTFAAANGCAQVQATTTVAITALPTAIVTYVASPYCVTSGTATPVVTGTQGGIFSGSGGLVINAVTGAVDLAASGAGTFDVEYKILAAANCSEVKVNTTIVISARPSATISYSNSPYCVTEGGKNVSRSGTSGGTFSASPAGLAINNTTGTITPASSTPGTYTVTLTFAAATGCAQVQTTTTVSITAMPTAIITYAASPYCLSAGTATPVITGTQGGIFSGSGGLVIHAVTGAINLAASGAGTFDVEYKMLATGNCSEVKVVVPVTINAAPTATISYGGPYKVDESSKSVDRHGTAGGVYSSSAGLNINTSTGAILPSASTPGTYTVTYKIGTGSGCNGFTATASVTILALYHWTGNLSADWSKNENWSSNQVPGDHDDVVILQSAKNAPTILEGYTAKMKNLHIQYSGQLTVRGGMEIKGNITNEGTGISMDTATITMKGDVAQNIGAGAFKTEVYNLVVENEAGVTLGGQLKIKNVLSVKKGTLYTNGHLVITSNSISTGRVGAITSSALTPIVGEVTVERYVVGRRKYRLITSSVTTSTAPVLTASESAKSIWGNWQNGGVAKAGVGTIITGGTIADGFDPATGNASLYTYNALTRRYSAFSSANGKNTKFTPLKAGVGYYMFVYGDRLNSISSATPNSTTLVQKGTLLTGNQEYTPTSAIPISNITGNFSLIGNPFACTIDWKSVSKTNVSKTTWGWDANLSSTGGYVTVTSTLLGALISPLSNLVAVSRYIQPGQAFFVQTTAANPKVVIGEEHKIDDKVAIFSNVFRGAGSAVQPLMAINLTYKNGSSLVLSDGAVVAFDSSYNDAVNDEDGLKFESSTENIGVQRDSNYLSIESRSFPVEGDTIALKVARLTRSQYTLQIFADAMQNAMVQPFLHDSYLKSYTQLSLTDTNYVSFNVSTADALSNAADRFRIVFRAPSTLPVNFTGISATKKDKMVEVKWDVASESGIENYQVLRATNGVNFKTIGVVTATGNNNSTVGYKSIDANPAPGLNYYQVRSVQKDGAATFSRIVQVKLDNRSPSIKVFPNPIHDNRINVLLSDLEAGNYTIELFNISGQKLALRVIQSDGGTANYEVTPDQKLSKGVYHLRVTGSNTLFNQNVILQ